MKYLLGITGPAGSGKDTVARFFIEQHRFLTYAFAEPVKRMLEVLAPAICFEDRDLKNQKHSFLSATHRRMMTSLGTDWGRNMIDPDIWVKKAIVELGEPRFRNHPIIVPDVRFDNEAAFIRESGDIIHLVGRRDHLNPEGSHVSENGIRKYPTDYTIDTSGTVSELYVKLTELSKLLGL